MKNARRYLSVVLASGLFLACSHYATAPDQPQPATLTFSVGMDSASDGSMLPTIGVSLRDSTGAVISAANDSITLRIYPDSSSSAIVGDMGERAMGGTAEFDSLTVMKAGTYIVVATAIEHNVTATLSITVSQGSP